MQSPPFPRYLVPPRSKYSPQHHVLKHPQLPFLPQFNDQVSHPYKTTGDLTLDVNCTSRLRTVVHSRRLTVMGLYFCSSLSRIPSPCFFRSSWNFLSSLEFRFVSGSACQTGYGGKFSFRYEKLKTSEQFSFSADKIFIPLSAWNCGMAVGSVLSSCILERLRFPKLICSSIWVLGLSRRKVWKRQTVDYSRHLDCAVVGNSEI